MSHFVLPSPAGRSLSVFSSILQLRSNAPLNLIVSSPTTAYTDMSFGMGEGKRPALCMTQHAASKFCQWLSAQTGHYYRLPTEAE